MSYLGEVPRPGMSLPPRWRELAPLLQNAIDRMDGWASLDQVLEAIMDDRAQYWPGKDTVLVTQIMHYAAGKTLRFSLVGGRMEEAWQLHDRALAWARTQGCIRAEILGRVGWIREMGPDWRTVGVILRREL
jgi:hypothetical protein